MALAATVKAQVFFSDDFSNSALPKWNITNHYANSTVLWKWSNSGQSSGNAAGTFQHGGAANGYLIVDSDGDGDDTGNTPEYTTVTSDAINCVGRTAVILTFYQYYSRFAADTPQVEISTNGTTWFSVYSPADALSANESTENPQFVEVDITARAANALTLYLRFSWKGSYDYWWFVDDVKLYVPDRFDVEAVEVVNTVSNGCRLTAAEPVSVTFKNRGILPVTTLQAHYSVNGGTPVTENVLLLTPLLYNSSTTYEFAQTADLSAVDVYSIDAWLTLNGDTATRNDTAFGLALSVNPVSIPPAYTMGFEFPSFGNEIDALTWTTHDANADENTWFLSNFSPNTGAIHYTYLYNFDATTPADDWLFSPCLSLTGGTAYKFSFFAKTGEDNGINYPEKLELKAGTGNTVADMTLPVFDFGAVEQPAYQELKTVFVPQTTGTYHFGLHCYSPADQWFLDIDDIKIEPLRPPVAQFTYTLNGTAATVQDASADLITGWQWNWGDGTTSIGKEPGTHTYAQPGTYTICLKVTNYAGADSICKTFTLTGLGDAPVVEQPFSVYPNPARGQLQVAFNRVPAVGTTLQLVNAVGEVVLQQPAQAQGRQSLPLQGIAAGVYWLQVQGSGQKHTQRVVVVP